MSRPNARNLAGAVALVAVASLATQYVVSNARPGMGDPLTTLWSLARYFTILTNALVAIGFGAYAMGRRPSDRTMAGIVLAIGLVGVVYHLLLAPSSPLQGLDFWADLGLHTLVPLGAVGWWLGWGGKGLHLRDLPYWVVWPLAYCAYALIRGAVDGRYPYFFLDLGTHDVAFVATYVAGISGGFLGAGLAMLVLARSLRAVGISR
ncbi:Pr6Pr family membrane protein [Pararhodobacter sp. CCB-MM2]|uniref:Pr6Pr family membrane protein n=1 Tax=Pararhodobacter sp. CCB-MM2 TaxID=1786003 RepID=UPI00082E8E8F|nr:Pr6Pr family membrane protein [Pararhodobacter sp. CCB-MM2]